MGGCRTFSGVTFSVPPDAYPLVIPPRYWYPGPFDEIFLMLDTDMDTTVYPNTSSFTVTCLGVPQMVESCYWGWNRELRLEIVGDHGENPMVVIQNVADNYFRSAAGGSLVQPWGPQTYTYES